MHKEIILSNINEIGDVWGKGVSLIIGNTALGFCQRGVGHADTSGIAHQVRIAQCAVPG
jgi:hypothetical protein